MVKRLRNAVKTIPDKKPYIEAITALLSIPVLITVILLNLNNLTAKKAEEKKVDPTPVKEVIIREVSPPKTDTSNSTKTVIPTPTSIQSTPSLCKKEIGPIDIATPREGQTVTDNPVIFTIRYTDATYCSVVWSYRINGGSWSEYSTNSPVVYNMPNGNVKLELRVQSTVSDDQITLQRNFIYQGQSSPTPTP